jgi:hypothetical protein
MKKVTHKFIEVLKTSKVDAGSGFHPPFIGILG